MIYQESASAIVKENSSPAKDEVIRLADDLYAMKEYGRNIRYLILGKEKAALIDLGYGFCNPWLELQSITKLPILPVCTHGDPDHALGARWFSKVYLHKDDIERVISNDHHQELKERSLYHFEKDASVLPFLRDSYLEGTLNDDRFIALEDGDFIDLGDRMLEVIHMPAHTHGSIALLDHKSGNLFIGDNASYDDVWMFCRDERVPSFSVVQESYRHLKDCASKYHTIYGAHGRQPLDVGIIDEIIECIDDLYDHYQTDEINPSRFISYVAKGQKVYNHYYKNVKLVYSEDQIEELRKGRDK